MSEAKPRPSEAGGRAGGSGHGAGSPAEVTVRPEAESRDQNAALDAPRMYSLEGVFEALKWSNLHARRGRVINLIGLIIEATGLEAEVGEVCEVETGRNNAAIPAEGVGFRGPRTLLMAPRE